MQDSKQWPYIIPYCNRMGSKPYYVEDEFRRAREYNMPRDTYSADPDHGPFLVRNMDPAGRERIENAAGVRLADLGIEVPEGEVR